MDDQIATPEMVNFLRASLKMLGGEVMEEKYVVKLVEHSKGLLCPLPGCKLRELTPLEVECLVLDFSLGFEAARVLAETSLFNGGNLSPEGYAMLRYAQALSVSSGSSIAAILGREERRAKNAGVFPPEATGVALEIDNDALCLFAGKMTEKARQQFADLSLSKLVNNFDLENWEPSDSSKLN